jgi:hypothetical protein
MSSRFEVSAHRPRRNAENAVGDCSGGVAVVIPQQPTESFATLDLTVLSVTTFWSFLREFSPLSRAGI